MPERESTVIKNHAAFCAFGVGIQISRDRLAQNGNPPLKFAASVGAVAAIVELKR